jgi:DNA-binding response OmpR family regulator
VTKILVVDDERPLLDIIQAVLEDEGYDVRTCASSVEADALLDEVNARPDVVLLDVMMPIMDGYTVLERALARRPDLPVIMMSASHPPGARSLGWRAFLRKPFGVEALLEQIRAHAGRAAHG